MLLMIPLDDLMFEFILFPVLFTVAVDCDVVVLRVGNCFVWML